MWHCCSMTLHSRISANDWHGCQYQNEIERTFHGQLDPAKACNRWQKAISFSCCFETPHCIFADNQSACLCISATVSVELLSCTTKWLENCWVESWCSKFYWGLNHIFTCYPNQAARTPFKFLHSDFGSQYPQIKALYPHLCAFSFAVPVQICIAKEIFVFLLTSSIFWCTACTYMIVYSGMMNRCKSVFNCLWKLAMVNTSCEHNAGSRGACKTCVAARAHSLFLPLAHFI